MNTRHGQCVSGAATERNGTTTPANYRQGSTWLQTSPVDSNHPLSGADRADERISEVEELKILHPGMWEISYNARSYTGGAGELVRTALFKNGRLIPGTEALTGGNAVMQTTAGQTILEKFDVNDVITLHAYRIGGGQTAVLSNGDGRTGAIELRRGISTSRRPGRKRGRKDHPGSRQTSADKGNSR
jgi:hypothetical protein